MPSLAESVLSCPFLKLISFSFRVPGVWGWREGGQIVIKGVIGLSVLRLVVCSAVVVVAWLSRGIHLADQGMTTRTVQTVACQWYYHRIFP